MTIKRLLIAYHKRDKTKWYEHRK